MKKEIISLSVLSLILCSGCGDDNIPIKKPIAINYTKQPEKDSEYYPKYKDSNNICGIAKGDEGTFAIFTSLESCPTEGELNEHGLKYTDTMDNYRPPNMDGKCGFVHLIHGENRITQQDLINLQTNLGDLDNIEISTEEKNCPTIEELSDKIENSAGIPLRFMYNQMNINTENYPVMNFDDFRNVVMVDPLSDEDSSLTNEYSDSKDGEESKIPRLLETNTAKDFCFGDFKNCTYDSESFKLTNTFDHQEYFITTNNGYKLPKFMMTKGAFTVCEGDFSRCDFYPNENVLNQGYVENIYTHAKYSSPMPIDVEEN